MLNSANMKCLKFLETLSFWSDSLENVSSIWSFGHLHGIFIDKWNIYQANRVVADVITNHFMKQIIDTILHY